MNEEGERRAAPPRGASQPAGACLPAKPEIDQDEKELALAVEHPRGTERRRLLPYRPALQDPASYAALPESDRDVIVRWAEIRRRIAGSHEIDNDRSNLADPLIPAERLRALVIEGERIAAGAIASSDERGDLLAAVARIRASR